MRYKFRPKQNKYNAKKCEIDGIVFPSQKEGRRYSFLKLLMGSGEVKTFIRQPLFDLGGGVVYKADFLIFWENKLVTVEDVKGFKTESFKRSKKIVESLYPFEIEVV